MLSTLKTEEGLRELDFLRTFHRTALRLSSRVGSRPRLLRKVLSAVVLAPPQVVDHQPQMPYTAVLRASHVSDWTQECGKRVSSAHCARVQVYLCTPLKIGMPRAELAQGKEVAPHRTFQHNCHW